MKRRKAIPGSILAAGILAACLGLSGCALLNLPFQIVGELLKIISKLPKPPPGVF